MGFPMLLFCVLKFGNCTNTYPVNSYYTGSPLTRYLRHTLSGLWVSSDGSLTPEMCYAADISTTETALQFCRDHHLTNIEIVLRFSPGIESRIPVADHD